jgi:hypothetical protein
VATNDCVVAVVVCYKRNISAAGEDTASAAPHAVSVLSGPIGYGGVTISVTGKWPTNWNLKDNDWILLCSTVTGTGALNQATWYRVVGAGYDQTSNVTNITLVGPDWNGGDSTSVPACTFTAVSVSGVTGVYTTTVQLDNDGIWSK